MRIACFSTYLEDLKFLASKAFKSLKGEIVCIAFRYHFKDEEIEKLRKLPINKLIVMNNILLMNYDVEAYASALADFYKKIGFDILLLGDKFEDKEIAARLSGKINVPAIISCVNFNVSDKKIFAERFHSCGIRIASIETEFPAIFSLEKYREEIIYKETEAPREDLKISLNVSRVIIRNKTRLSEKHSQISDSRMLFVLGENIHDEKEVKEIEELSSKLGLQVTGDKTCFARGWFKEWVGFSNLKVKPEIYFAIGVKGDIDHLGAIMDSKLIISMNEDPDSPIFRYSDYYLIGDIHKIIPKLSKKIKKYLS